MSRTLVTRSTLLGVAAALVLTSMPTFVAAEESLDEVLVTARKREEKLQDVPLTITAIQAADLERLGIKSAEDVAALDASVIFDRGFSATDSRIAIRGLSPTRGRNNVAVLVDGVDITSESIAFAGGSLLANNRLMDLARVEVVKGPQSALYGRSAFAGAIQYVTADPAKELGGKLSVDGSQYGRLAFTGSVSGPISDTLGFRLNGTYWKNDGFYRNSITGGYVDKGDGNGLALTGKWAPSDDFNLKGRIEYSNDKNGPGATAIVRHNVVASRIAAGAVCLPTTGIPGVPFPRAGCPVGQSRPYGPTLYDGPAGNSVYLFQGVVPSADKLAIRLDPNPKTGKDYVGSEVRNTRASIVANWDLSSGTLTSTTGFTNAKYSFLQDGDFDSSVVNGVEQPVPAIGGSRAASFDYDGKTKQFSEELRFQSKLEGPANFALGGVYWNEKSEQTARSINVFCLPFVPPNVFNNPMAIPPACPTLTANQVLGQVNAIPRFNSREIDHKSIYGLLEFKFASIWKASGEVRYSDETESVVGVNCSPTLTLPAGSLGPGSPASPCNDPSVAGFQVFGPSVVNLYPYFQTLPFFFVPPPYPPLAGATQVAGVTAVVPDFKSKFTTPKFTIEVKPSDHMLFYASVAKSVKPGGVSTVTSGGWQDVDYSLLLNALNPNRPQDTTPYSEFTFKDEKLTSFELGAKTEFLDRRLRINAAVFVEKYKDKQIGAQLITPSGTAVGRLLNAGRATINGLEIDSEWRATQNLTLGANVTLLDSKFTDFPYSSTSPTDAVRVGSCARAAGDVSVSRACSFNLKGNKLERVPKYSAVATARYVHPFGAGNFKWFVEGDAQAQAKRFLDFQNRQILPSYVLGNIRLGITGDHLDVLLYVNNVGNNKKPLTGNQSPGDVDQFLADPYNFSPADDVQVTLPDPRIVGIRVGYRIGGGK